MQTRLAGLPRPLGWAVLGLTLAAILALLVFAAGLPQPTPEALAAQAAEPGDIASYRRIVERLRGGEAYHHVAHEVLVADGFGTRSVFNWRTPAWPLFIAAFPEPVVRGLLGALGMLGVVMGYRMLRAEGGVVVALVSGLAVTLSLGAILVPQGVFFTEVVAGTIILVSVTAYGNGWRALGLCAGLAALFLRELVAPYVIVCAVLALRERRWREVAGWGAGLAAYAVYFGWHALMVAQQIGPMDRADTTGWVQFGGLGFVFATAGFNGLLSAPPEWWTAVLAPLGLLGLWAWPNGTRALAMVLAYMAIFAVVGKPFNAYWGALYTPVLMLGLGWAWAAMRDGARGLAGPAPARAEPLPPG